MPEAHLALAPDFLRVRSAKHERLRQSLKQRSIDRR
jgi:hypothetical protein